MKRNDVYKLIDGERDYQDELPASRTLKYDNGSCHTVGDYVTMLSHYTNKAVEEWTLNPGDDAALNIMRKIAGIAVHCMEDHGAPERKK